MERDISSGANEVESEAIDPALINECPHFTHTLSDSRTCRLKIISVVVEYLSSKDTGRRKSQKSKVTSRRQVEYLMGKNAYERKCYRWNPE